MSRVRNSLKSVPGLPTAYRFVKDAALVPYVRSPFIRNYPPGTFYSPIPGAEDVPASIAKMATTKVAAIDVREAEQVALAGELGHAYAELPFSHSARPDRRFHLDNPYYSYFDAITLYGMLRHYNPRRVVEIGSGFSSALMLDTRDLFLDRETQFTFIDPYPERLESLLRPADRGTATVLAEKAQDVNLDTFTRLTADDILFIDSSHVVKFGSDVAWIVFEILPRLQPGVIVHFHDIFWPFEYPLHWLRAGRAWNEAYILRAFLQYNRDFEILFFNSFMAAFHPDVIRDRMPAAMEPSSFELTEPASSLWLRRS